MPTTSCRVTNTHESCLKEMNAVRKELWEKIYTNLVNMNILTGLIYKTFPTETIDKIEYDFNNNSIKMVTNKILPTIHINSYMLNAVSQFVNILYNNKTITQNQHEVCRKRLAMLYNVTLNNNCNIEIKL